MAFWTTSSAFYLQHLAEGWNREELYKCMSYNVYIDSAG